MTHGRTAVKNPVLIHVRATALKRLEPTVGDGPSRANEVCLHSSKPFSH